MVFRKYKTPIVNKKNGDIYTGEYSYGDPDNGVTIIASTDNYLKRLAQAMSRVNWDRTHPYLALFRNATSRFINNDILLNANNGRVVNANLHPEGLDWFRQGGDAAVALLAAATAPIWAPELGAVLPYLSTGASSNALMSNVLPSVALKSAPELANLVNWGMLTTGGATLAKMLYDNSSDIESAFDAMGKRRRGKKNTGNSLGATPEAEDTPAVENPPIPVEDAGNPSAEVPVTPNPPENRGNNEEEREEQPKNRLPENRLSNNSSQLPPNNDPKWYNIFWETKNHNFGPNHYRLRNVVRTLPPAAVLTSYDMRHRVYPKIINWWWNGSLSTDTVPKPTITEDLDTVQSVPIELFEPTQLIDIPYER